MTFEEITEYAKIKKILLTKDMNKLPKTLALALAILLISGFGAAIVAQGSVYFLNSFATALAGSNAQGSAYSARTHLTYQTGTKNAEGAVYIGNVGFFGSSSTSSQLPSINLAYASPSLIAVGLPINLFISARYAINTTSNITFPNGTTIPLNLTNEANTTFNNTQLVGVYQVLFLAINRNGEASSSGSFEVRQQQNFTLKIQNFTDSEINSSVKVTYDGIEYGFATSNGTFNFTLPDAIFNFEINTSLIEITLRGVNLSSETGKMLLIDDYMSDGFLATYSISNFLNITNATVRIPYFALSNTDSQYLRLFVCHEYNFSERSCTGSWQDITAESRNDGSYFEYDTAGFSAFSIKEEMPVEEAKPGSAKSTGFFIERPKMKMEISSDCNAGLIRFKITDELGKPVAASLTIRGRNGYYSKEQADYGDSEMPLENGSYYALAKNSEYSDASQNFNIDCPEKMQQIMTENNTAPQEVLVNNSITGFVSENSTQNEPVQQKPETILQKQENQPLQADGTENNSNIWVTTGIIFIMLVSSTLLITSRKKQSTRRAEKKPVKKEDGSAMKTQIEEITKVDPSEPTKSIAVQANNQNLTEMQTTPPTPEAKASGLKFSALLRDLEQESHFLVQSGERIRSMAGLAMALEKMPEDVFYHHVTPDRNDFAAWLYHSVGDGNLAQRIGPLKLKGQLLAEVEKRIAELIS
jgi:hypothetical protein